MSGVRYGATVLALVAAPALVASEATASVGDLAPARRVRVVVRRRPAR